MTRVNLDFFDLQEHVAEKTTEHEETTVAKSSITVLVMQETECASAWAYAVETNGSGAENLVAQILDDLETIVRSQEQTYNLTG